MKAVHYALAIALSAGVAHAGDKAAVPAAPAVTGEPAAQHGGGAHPVSACAEPKPDCAATVTPAFGKDGRLWIAYSVGKSVYVASSRDLGKSFDTPAVVATTQDGVIDANGDARPNVVALNDGGLLASYTVRPDKVMIGTIFTAVSKDGKSFSAPQPILTEGGQRFEAFAVSPKGRIWAAWLDKTHALKAKAEGRDFAGSGIAFGWSDDGGKTFKGKEIGLDHACECCRVTAALDRDGLPVFAWRQVYEGNMRDHEVAKLGPDGAIKVSTRVSQDDWSTNACPHHGPSIAIDSTGGWNVVWFAKGKKNNGLFFANSHDGGKSFSAPQKFGDDERAPSHPWVLATKGRLHRAWKEFDGENTTIVIQSSRDGGKAWSSPRVLAATAGASDHPLLIAQKGVAYLSWATAKDGYRLISLPASDDHAQK